MALNLRFYMNSNRKKNSLHEQLLQSPYPIGLNFRDRKNQMNKKVNLKTVLNGYRDYR